MFRRYQPRGVKLSFENDSVRVSNQTLSFSYEIWEKCFKKSERIALFFEEESNQIGVRGDTTGYMVSDAQSYKVVRWAGFIKAIKFDYKSPITKKLVQKGDLWIIEKEKEKE